MQFNNGLNYICMKFHKDSLENSREIKLLTNNHPVLVIEISLSSFLVPS